MAQDQPPPSDVPFAEKLAFYKTQHQGRGVRVAHLVGIPTIVAALPLLFAKPKIGAAMFTGGWAIQLIGHRFFEHNMPSLKAGPITYQLCGLAHWSEEIGGALARRAARRRSSFASADQTESADCVLLRQRDAPASR